MIRKGAAAQLEFFQDEIVKLHEDEEAVSPNDFINLLKERFRRCVDKQEC